MKYVLVIGDGMADTALEQLGGKTPIESLALKHFDILAGSEEGTARTVPLGVPAGSDTAILNIFGYDPRHYYSGRSALEAAGVGVLLKKGEVSFRLNLCAVENNVMLSHNGGGIEGDDVEQLMQALLSDARFNACAEKMHLRIAVSRTFRHIGVIDAPDEDTFIMKEPHNILTEKIDAYMPQGAFSAEMTELMRESFRVLDRHPINLERRKNGALPANMLWPWGPGRAMILPSFKEKYHLSGAVISAVPLVWGIAALSGLPTPRVEGATGDLDTNYEGKTDCALDALSSGADFAAIHVEAPDEMTHAGRLDDKLEAIRRIDQRVIARLLDKLPSIDADFRILLLSDHLTLTTTRTHDGTPVPFALYDSRHPGTPKKFDEKNALQGIALANGDMLLPRLFEK